MSVSGSSFQWLDILEAEFNRAHVEIDVALKELEPDEYNLASSVRQRLRTICTSFCQLSEKAQSVFQNNCKLEAQLYSLREDLTEARAQCAMVESDYKKLTYALHEAQLEKLSPTSPQPPLDFDQAQSIRKSLENGKEALREKRMDEERLRAEAMQLREENVQLRQWLMDTESELFAALLATRCLDKELAGRIQQIQLLARDLRGCEHDHLWNQLEAEINLHRHKTVAQACRQRKKRGKPNGHQDVNGENGARQDGKHLLNVANVIRQVEIFKGPGQSLGLTVTGGTEHGVPIVISEIQPGKLADRSGAFLVGDAVLSVNGDDLRGISHLDAVRILSQLSGNVTFELLYVSGDSDSELEEVEETASVYESTADDGHNEENIAVRKQQSPSPFAYANNVSVDGDNAVEVECDEHVELNGAEFQAQKPAEVFTDILRDPPRFVACHHRISSNSERLQKIRDIVAGASLEQSIAAPTSKARLSKSSSFSPGRASSRSVSPSHGSVQNRRHGRFPGYAVALPLLSRDRNGTQPLENADDAVVLSGSDLAPQSPNVST